MSKMSIYEYMILNVKCCRKSGRLFCLYHPQLLWLQKDVSKLSALLSSGGTQNKDNNLTVLDHSYRPGQAERLATGIPGIAAR